jgi:hypothetical protein
LCGQLPLLLRSPANGTLVAILCRGLRRVSSVRRPHADLTRAGFDVWFDRVSMPSRQLTFHQEIRDAIAARDRLLLDAGSSDGAEAVRKD